MVISQLGHDSPNLDWDGLVNHPNQGLGLVAQEMTMYAPSN